MDNSISNGCNIIVVENPVFKCRNDWRSNHCKSAGRGALSLADAIGNEGTLVFDLVVDGGTNDRICQVFAASGDAKHISDSVDKIIQKLSARTAGRDYTEINVTNIDNTMHDEMFLHMKKQITTQLAAFLDAYSR